MNNKRKKQLTYLTIAIFFLLGGIEYAVILPTLWLYISDRYGAEAYFLGIILSAFSFMGLFSGPIMGRWSDRTGKTKGLLLFANLWEIGGNIMYWMGFNKWFILGSRLVAGVGTGVAASIIADVALATNPEERTGILSILMLCRQVGLLFGPAFNLFLQLCNFKIGPFVVDAYTVPGLFMALLWLLHELMVICLYYELKELRAQEQINTHIKYSNSDTTIANMVEEYASLSTIAGRSETPSQSITGDNTISSTSRSNLTLSGARDQNLPPFSDSPTRSRFGAGFVLPDASGSIQTIDCQVGGETFHTPDRQVRVIVRDGFEDSYSATDKTNGSAQLSRSASKTNEMIESAEKFMNVNLDGATEPSRNGVIGATDSPLSKRRDASRITPVPGYGSINRSHSNAELSTYSIPEPPLKTGWSSYVNEYLREEIVVILFAVFASLFNQTGLEAMVTPLTQRFLGWAEFGNSMMYLVAGFEVCLVFLLVRWFSKCMTDCTLILGGFVVEVVGISWLLYFMPTAKDNDPGTNLAPFIVGVFLDCFGLPFVFTCSISLYSKVTNKETQGSSQGLRRSVAGLATIIGPLWTGSLVNSLYICLAGMLACMVFALSLICLSFKHIRNLEIRNKEETAAEREKEAHSSGPDEEQQPLLT